MTKTMTAWGGVPNETLPMMFTCCPNLMFLASPWLEICRFSNWSFYWLWAVQSWYLFCWLLASQNWPYLFPLLTLDRLQLFNWVWISYVAKNNPNPLPLMKIQEPCIGSAISIFNDSISRNQELVSSVKK